MLFCHVFSGFCVLTPTKSTPPAKSDHSSGKGPTYRKNTKPKLLALPKIAQLNRAPKLAVVLL